MKTCLLICYFGTLILLIGCVDSGNSDSAPMSAEMLKGKDLYDTYCTSCHGATGDMGLSGAMPLTSSTLSAEESLQVVLKGRKVMAGFEGILSKEDAEKIVDYITTLRK